MARSKLSRSADTGARTEEMATQTAAKDQTSIDKGLAFAGTCGLVVSVGTTWYTAKVLYTREFHFVRVSRYN